MKVKKMSETALLPTRATPGSAGFDLYADFPRTVWLGSGDRLLVPTGIAIELPEDFEGQIRPRSGLAQRHGVTVLNAPGTIDADYRGEIGVLLINHGRVAFPIAPGDRIAQLVIARVTAPGFEVVDELSPTNRGAGGYGSTGR